MERMSSRNALRATTFHTLIYSFKLPDMLEKIVYVLSKSVILRSYRRTRGLVQLTDLGDSKGR